MLHLKNNIKKIRKLQGLTQENFSLKMKVTYGMQKSYEQGLANPDDLYLERLSDELGISIKDLKNKNFTASELEKIVNKDKKDNTEMAKEDKKITIETDMESIVITIKKQGAVIKALADQLAKVCSKAYERPVEEFVDELLQNTRIHLKNDSETLLP